MNKNRKILSIILAAIILIGGGFSLYYFLLDGKSSASKQLYTCAMHPQVISDHPGQCPICGMDLILKTDNNKDSLTNLSRNKMGDTVLNAVNLSPSQQVLANVQTEKIKTRAFSGEKTFNGYVKMNEKGISHISTPVMGKLTKMYVNFEGEQIRKGQPVFELYSPDLVSAQKEYLLALDNYNKVNQSGNQFATEQAKSLVNASKDRLSNWELTDSQFEELIRTRNVEHTLTIYSKYSGIVTKKLVSVGHWPMAGEDIYDIADLSTVWVIANVYENDVQYIKNGQTAQIISASYPDEPIFAKINYIDPVFNPDSRTLEVRIDVANKNNKLRPGMYVKVKINTYMSQSLSVSKNAVIRAGERNYVYIEKEKGVYVPREVQIGFEQDGYYSVTSGLREGDVVVTSGGFLLDSESQIQSGFATSQHQGHDMNKMNNNSDEEKLKINPDQDIMKDMDMKNKK